MNSAVQDRKQSYAAIGQRRLSLDDLAQSGARLASALSAGGVKEDHSVAVMMSDRSRMGSRGSIVYTSGTTGQPKGVKRFALNLEDARKFSELSEQWFGLRAGKSRYRRDNSTTMGGEES